MTYFDPHIHGFRFSNQFRGGDVVSELGKQGRLSGLVGLETPRVVADLADVTARAGFWGTFGLCGGMSWAALDRYFAERPAEEQVSAPEAGDALFSELVGRQADSMGGRDLLVRCLEWQLDPDTTPWWWFWSRGVHELTTRHEWPTLRSLLDDRVPVSLTLIRASGAANPSLNHQVVAYAYEEDGRQRNINLYDPNHPGATSVLGLEADDRGRLIECRQSTGESLRGFFVWSYHPVPA
ncbi:MAG: hypothetical protein WB239_08545 [Acidimicrobiia bacterium]